MSVEIAYRDPSTLLMALSRIGHVAFLDSSRPDDGPGRYSYLAADPVEWLVPSSNRFDALARALGPWILEPDPGLPPFQGGLVGLFGYDLGRELERIPPHSGAGQGFPDLAVGLYDVVVAFDHAERRAWVVSTGYPEEGADGRIHRAERRLEWMVDLVARAAADAGSPVPITLLPRVERAVFVEQVERVIDYIHAGDIYQANLSLPFEGPLPAGFDGCATYLRLRSAQPAPFSAFLDLGDGRQVLSLSMERFLRLSDGAVETRPIKGTRPRSVDPEEDRRFREELVQSPKDRAENVMIVDLLRNDLSRVCRPHTVRVPALCAVESHAAVHHLVSTVVGELETGVGPVDLLRAAFPGGSITGAPKIRAMEVIAELETVPRGPYCGSIGYIGFDGSMDTNILIRTVVAGDGRLTLRAGAGIVADSDPEAEYEECLAKVGGLIGALGR